MIRVNDYAIQKGVSRQSVYQKMKKPKYAEMLLSHVTERGGITYLDDEAVKILNGDYDFGEIGRNTFISRNTLSKQTNYEYYFDEIVDYFSKCTGMTTDAAMMKSLRFVYRKNSYSTNEGIYAMMEWYRLPYARKVKLTKHEFDMLNCFRVKNSNFKSCELFMNMKRKGYFKGVYDEKMQIQYILANAMIV